MQGSFSSFVYNSINHVNFARKACQARVSKESSARTRNPSWSRGRVISWCMEAESNKIDGLEAWRRQPLMLEQSSDRSAPDFYHVRSVLLYVFISMFLVSSIGCLWDQSRHLWPTTTGVVIKSVVPTDPHGRPMWRPLRVEYQYSVNGNSHDGQTEFDPLASIPAVHEAGKKISVFYCPFWQSASTISPSNNWQTHLIWMAFFASCFVVCLFVRPFKTHNIREELPTFLDKLAALVHSGVSAYAAVEMTTEACANSCPSLCLEMQQAVLKLKNYHTPLHESITLMARTSGVEELNALASTLATASKDGGSIAEQLRSQSFALRYRNEARRVAGRRYTNKTRPSLLIQMDEQEQERKRNLGQ